MPRQNQRFKGRGRPKRPKRRRNNTRRSVGIGRPTLNNAWLTVSGPAPLFPVSMRQRGMRYYDYGQQMTAAAGLAVTRFFSVNGLFDPDISGSGHQPMGFDQMMLMYNQYYVSHATITVTGIPETIGAAIGLYLSPDTTQITDPIRLIENGQMKLIHLDGASAHIGSISLSCNVARYFGRKGPRSVLNDPDLQGTAAANPAEQVYFGVMVFNFYNVTPGVVLDYDVELVFDAVFTERKKLTVS